MLTRVTALEEARHGVRVFALAPGIIETGMQVRIREQAKSAFPAVRPRARCCHDGPRRSAGKWHSI